MDFISRLAPDVKDRFTYEIIEKTTERDFYGYKVKDNKIHLFGTDKVCVARAFGKYLQNCQDKCIAPFCAEKLTVTEAPLPEEDFSEYIDQKWRVFGDYTFYSNEAWRWDLNEWEYFLDILAINGINMAVNLVGNEGLCFYTLLKMDFPQSFALEFVSGPAFYAWQMSNRFDNYVPNKSFDHIERGLEMGKKIVQRMKDLGITPVLSTFSGLVPTITPKLFDAKQVTIENKWAGFAKTYRLRIDSVNFRRFFLKYLEIQEEYIGHADYFICNQLCASSVGTKKKEIAYLENAARELDRAMDYFNENATLVFTSEGYRKEFADRISRCGVMVFDIDASMHEKTDFFSGHEFILGNSQHNNSHNSMQGDISEVAENPYIICKEKCPNCVGAGLFPESLRQNPMFFALSFDVVTENKKIDLDDWYKKYETARYGKTDDKSGERISLYLKTCYSSEHSAVPVGSAICTRPQLNLRHTGLYDRVEPLYGNADLLKIYRSLEALDSNTEGFRYDLVNIAKQLLDNDAYFLHKEIAALYRDRNMDIYSEKVQKFLEIIDDVNEILVTNRFFNASCFIDELKKIAVNDDELTYFIINFIASIGLWGPMIEDNQRYDYGWQILGNFLPCYQKIRWEKFFEHLSGQFRFLGFQEKSRKQYFDRDLFVSNPFYSDMARFEQGVILTFNPPPFEEKDTKKICSEKMNKYYI